ncbi:MAG: uroporphyrinogen decarboxylase family protein [Armatimonadota bacterium]|nr:uroporphyrinogen decarboxylase family protein [Armatimonadota bacterium]
MSYLLLEPVDFEAHNEEVKRVWEAYNAGKPIRVPMMLGVNPRVILLNPELNSEGITFADYMSDPDIMAAVQLRTQSYVRHNLMQDAEMGPPSTGWSISIDTQNTFEAAWFGAMIVYRDRQVPVTEPMLGDDDKHKLFDRGIPDPFEGGMAAWNWRFYEHMLANKSHYVQDGQPVVSVTPAGLGTDGPMTVAANLRGTTQICEDIYEDPDYVHQLLDYITSATIDRIKAYRKALGLELKPQCWWFADDSIELLSPETYREFVLPYHKTLLNELAGEGPHSVHLCGSVDHLMCILKEELNVQAWDAGYPVDYGAMRAKLGPEFQIATGPTVSTLLYGSPESVWDETKRILSSGIMQGKFILREANNLSPCTPVENVAAMYECVRQYGKY